MNVNNRIRLKQEFPNIYLKMKALEESNTFNNSIVKSKNDSLNIVLSDGKYLYSRYNPENEMKSFLEDKNIEKAQHIFLIGVGLGYIIDEILSRNSTIKITVYEPDPHILFRYLSLKALHNNIVNIFCELEDVQNFKLLDEFFSVQTLTIMSPIYSILYAEKIETLQKKLVTMLTSKRGSLAVNTVFQQAWVINSIVNFPKVIDSSNILNEKYQTLFKDKPAILVAAGPSLNEEFDNLHKIKKDKTAYIFAVGSAINALINNGILPDAVFAYDPGDHTKVVLDILNNSNLQNQIPLIFGSTIGFQALEQFEGPKAHFITSADVITKNLFQIEERQIVLDSPSIAVMTLQILKKLDMNPIILVGQNLGYFNNKKYAEGIQYEAIASEISDIERTGAKIVKDVYGNDMFTDQGYIDMRVAIEQVLDLYNSGEVINTTKYGAHIEGTKFLELQDVMKIYLNKNNVVVNNWVFPGDRYEGALELFSNLKVNYEKFLVELNIIIRLANDIKLTYEKGIYAKLSNEIGQFNRRFKKLIESEIHDKIVRYGATIQHTVFMNRFNQVNYEKNPKKQGENFMEITFKYVGTLSEIAPKFYSIIKHIENEMREK